MSMKVSIITPFHRGEAYLRDCAESLRAQEFRDFEWILVLDQAEEDISALLQEFRESFPIKVVYLEPGESQTLANGSSKVAAKGLGTAIARNRGIEEAEGEYLYFLDSDDYLYEEAIGTLVQAAEEEDAQVTYGKKVWTWYTRAGFLSTFRQSEAGDSEGGEEEEDSDKGGAGDEAEAEESSNGEETEESSDAADAADADALDTLESVEEQPELSPEEQLERARRRTAKRLISKRRGIRNISILHILIRRDLIEQYQIRFNEQFRYYSDLSFVAEIVEHAVSFRREYHALYIKRKHGDPIHFPSLSQEKSGQRFDEMMASYEHAISKISAEGTVRARIDRKLINYYTGFFVTRIRRSRKDHWRGERFELMKRLVSGMSPDRFKRLNRYKKKCIKALLAGNRDKTYRLVSRKLAVKKIRRFIKKPQIAKALYIHWFLKMPIKENWVLCECFFAKSYGDNPKGIYEYLSQAYPGKYRFIWSLNKKTEVPFPHKRVKRFSIRYAYYVARCKYFVFNTKQPGWMRKRKDQVFLETWHGTPLKRLAFDMEDNFSAAPGYKAHIYKQTRSWNYLVAANSFSSEIFRSCFLYNGEMLEYGYPRNDILHRPDRDELALSIRKKLGIPTDKKTILYAPTWRDDEYYAAGQYKFTLKLDLPKLKEALSDDYVILLRTHYYIADKLDVTGMEGFAYNLSKYDDIADIYLISDICITDYSSVFFDYANLRRPLLFYTYDLEKYRGMLRGFYIDMEATVPGPLLFTTEEVIEAIEHIEEINSRYQERYDAFYERFCGWEDGHASENIARKVFGLPGGTQAD